jgi:hypothetical protein
MPHVGPAFMAGGNISPSRFVTISTSANNTVVQSAAATETIIGVSQESAKQPPIPQVTGTQYAAESGDNLRVYTAGEANVLLELGTGGCTAGAKLTSDADGKAVAATGANMVGAIALTAGAAGELVRAYVTFPFPNS